MKTFLTTILLVVLSLHSSAVVHKWIDTVGLNPVDTTKFSQRIIDNYYTEYYNFPKSWNIVSVLFEPTSNNHANDNYVSSFDQYFGQSIYNDTSIDTEGLGQSGIVYNINYKQFVSDSFRLVFVRFTPKFWKVTILLDVRQIISWSIDTTFILSNSNPYVIINDSMVTKTGRYIERLKSISGGDSTLVWHVIDNATSVNKINSNSFKIYPNPCNDYLTIEPNKTANVIITDMVGRVVLKQLILNKGNLNISYLKTGVYIVKVGDYTTKIFKK